MNAGIGAVGIAKAGAGKEPSAADIEGHATSADRKTVVGARAVAPARIELKRVCRVDVIRAERSAGIVQPGAGVLQFEFAKQIVLLCFETEQQTGCQQLIAATLVCPERIVQLLVAQMIAAVDLKRWFLILGQTCTGKSNRSNSRQNEASLH